MSSLPFYEAPISVECQHPHPSTLEPEFIEWSRIQLATPREPDGLPSQTLFVLTDAGWISNHGIADNPRARRALAHIGERLIRAGLVLEYRLEEGLQGARWSLPDCLLSIGLAEAEQRFCVAAWLRRERLPELMGRR